jgi:hypothetical protein
MARILFPFQRCPAWLERIEFTTPGPKAVQRVAALSIVTVEHGEDGPYFQWRPILPMGNGCLLFIYNDGGSVVVHGQSPKGGDGTVVFWLTPLIDWPLLCIAAVVCAFLLGRA